MDISEQLDTGLSLGKKLEKGDWPDDAKCAVNFSITVHPPWIPLKMHLGPKAIFKNENLTLTGINRILAMFNEYNIKGTFEVLGYTVERYPELFRRVHSLGHEIRNIGYLRQDQTVKETKNEIKRANTIILKVVGEKPVGVNLNNYSKHTLKLLSKHGFLYEKSFVGQEMPCEVLVDGESTGVISIPGSSEMDDYMQLSYMPSIDGKNIMKIWSPIRHLESPEARLKIWKNEFDACYNEGLLLSTLFHPEVSGKASHSIIFREFIQYVKSHPKVWIATAKDIALWTKKRI